MSFNEWKEVELQEVTENYNTLRKPLSSKQRSTKQGTYNYYGAQGVIDYIDEYMLEGEYLLVAEDGANLETRNDDIARLTKKDEKFWVNNHAHVIKSNEKSDIRYIKYVLNIMDISAYITGSAQPKLNKNNLNKISLTLPPVEEQKAIAKILSDLDNKIEVNNKINQRLEEMAQSIFKHWFVDFEFPNEEGKPYKSSGGQMVESELGMIPKGWKVGTLSDIAIFKNGKALKTKLRNENGENLIYGSNGVIGKTDEVLQETECIIIGRVGAYCGSIQLSRVKCWITDNAIISVPREKNVLPYLYRFLLNYPLRENAGGSAQPLINQSMLNSIPVVIPQINILDKYYSILDKIIIKISKSNKENEDLSNLRDILLPKLMSGEIRVPIK